MTASRLLGRTCPTPPDSRPRRGLLRSARALAAAVWLATLGVPALPASPENATLTTDTTAARTINNRVRNANPVFANTTETRTVRENSAPGTNVGLPIPEATDADAGDTLTYSMEGADAGSFAFDASTRQITTIMNVDYNHEATKNSYSVTVKASDGTDSDTVAVTINVTDVDEQPAKPGRPRLATDPDSDSATTLDAIWREPLLNGGPAITGYDLEYREGTGGNWTGFAHSGTAVTTTITGLTGDTEYQMRVRAKNGEVDSEWSDASDGVRTEAADATLGVLRVVTDSAALADYQSNTTSYAMSVPNSDDEATMTATANDGGASVEILDSSDMGITDADAMKDGFQVALAVGSTVIKVKVTADDGTTTQTYTVTVTRATAGNNAPAFPSSTATREVPENSAAGTDVGLPIPEATDEDSGDTLTYSMGGADAGSFAFDASTRQITTKTGVTYNHEAAKNTYEVTVNADDGTDSGAIPVTINVTDVDEQPAKPGQPRLATVPGSSTSLTATWTKPGLNGGPEIIGYDVEHREGTSGDWIRFPHSGTEVTATITGLQANAEYQVQVRAENGEADSDWSDASDAVRTNVADAPESFEAWSGNAQVRLTWDAPGADADITRHEYRFKTTGDYPDLWTGIGDSAPGGAQEDGVVVTGLTNDVAYTFQLRSANADDASTAAAAGPVTPRPGVCSRTRQVRDAIVAAISDVSHCAQVTTTQLAGVTRLELQNTDLRSLQPDDFSGLTALYWLFLENNELSSLPAGVFSGLTALSSLNLRGNDLVSLPADVFSGLTALQTLYLHANKLDLLPDDAFSGLTALRILQLTDNKLDLLADDAFSGLTALQTLYLSDNMLDSLVDDVFSDLTVLQRLYLTGNKLGSLPDDVFSGLTALQRLYLTGNKLGSLPDDVFSGLTALQRLYLSGNKLGSLPDDMFSGLTALQRLYLSGNKLDLLPAGVFSDLTALQRLGMSGNSLGSLPGDVFSGLTALTYLWVNNNELSSLPDGVFSDLTAIRQISLQNNPLGSLPDDVFSGLVALETLQLFENELSSLPDDVFSGLVALEILQLFENELSSLPDDVFSALTALEELWLNDNDLAALPDEVFSGLTTLTTLSLGGNPNPGDVLPLTVTVEKVGTDQARAKVLAGAPFAVDFTPAVVNGALAGGATALGVAAGSVDGTAVTVERTSGTMAAVTVDVDLTTQPTLPEGHAGYEFAKATGSEPQEILPQVGTTPNNAPVFANATETRTVPENSTAGTNVGSPIPEATDADSGDTLTYSMEGADAASFAFDASTRQITTIANVFYNYEATKNSYSVTVKASDGTDSATVAVTINVTDVGGEAPAAPSAPSVSAASVTSLSVTWTAAANAGPAITDYDYRHRTTSPQGTWTEVTNTTITGLSATIESLAEDTSYDVQVRATNGEGTGDWSASGAGSTDANAAPAFDSSATFTPDENQTTAGTVLASDGDAGDDVTGYAITGGADQGKFSIHSTSGALMFDAAPNFEDPDDADTDGSYQVTVQATSGAGEREKTATQAITVTVADVGGEKPTAPAAPNVSAASVTSLNVNWTAPANAGPAITDYDYRHRTTSPVGNWTEVTDTTSTVLSATIGSLAEDTSYDVQVRATNAEGTGDWSASGSGTTDANAAPAFDSSATFNPNENQTTAGTVLASDGDAGDDVTGYAITGGADQGKFSIHSTSGALMFDAAPNFEDPDDADTDGSYQVTVQATSGAGEREKTATQAITVTVADVGGEKPTAPAAPNVSAASVTSLNVNWTAPANAGPAITDYDYRHRTTSPVGNWTEVTDTTSTVLSATIGSLAEDTSYDVQVRATNAEGTGDWSASGSGTTDANAAPAFDSSATFNPNENQTTAGTVVASDSDMEDDIEDYAITGGADQGKFSIHSTSGALTFKAAPNFEDPDDANTDGRYQVTVEATSGTGTREKTATQAITVTVADVNERSAKPAKPTLAPVESSTTSLAASWTKPDLDGGPDITDYDVRYREGTSGGWTDVTHDGAGRTRTLAGLAADTAYQAQVRADNGELESDWSDPSDAVRTNAEEATAPDAPRDVTATAAGETRIDLDWRAPADDGGSAITGYRIEVSDDGGLSFEALATTGAAVTRYAHTGLSAGTTRHYQVYAVNAEGESPASSVVGATTEEEREPEGNEPSVIRTYWIGSGGSNDKSGCAGTEEFRAYWNPPLDRNDGGVRRFKVAGAWEADLTLRGGASDLGYTIQDTGGNPEHPELTGSVRIDGNGWLSMRVRGRFGADGWGGWSPTSSLYCWAASARVDGPLLALTWPTPRDGFAAPDGGDFAVHADGAAVAVTGAALVGRRALLTLGAPALAGQSVSVNYLGSAMHPLADAAGAPVPAWTDLAAENLTGEPPDAAWAAVLALAAAVRSDAPGLRALFNPGTDPASLSLAGAGLADADLAALWSPGGPRRPARSLPADAFALAGLRRLDLSGNKLADVSLLADLRGLESLDLSGNALTDIAPLSTLTTLRRLDLRGNRVADLAPLASLPRLKVLLLDGNRLADVGALTHLGTLEHLGLSENAVMDLAPLSDLWSLRRLDLGGNPAVDLSPLGDLGTLEWLRVPAADGVPAHRLIRLRWLWTGPAGVCLGCGERAP